MEEEEGEGLKKGEGEKGRGSVETRILAVLIVWLSNGSRCLLHLPIIRDPLA